MPLRYNWPETKIVKWYKAGATAEEIVSRLGVITDHLGSKHVPSAAGVLKVLRRLGCEIRPVGAAGARNGNWKGGRRIDKNGYVWVRCPDHPDATGHGYVQEHRLVAEKVLGRRLRPEEVVHHDDDNRQNNDPNNLIVYPDNATHLRETRKGKRPNWSKQGYKRILQHLEKFRASQASKRRQVKSAGIRLSAV